MKFFNSKFWQNESGSFVPLFAIGLLVLIPAMGMALDYSRVLNLKSKMQSAADSAVFAGIADAHRGESPQIAVEGFLAANLPDIDFQTRGIMENGRPTLQVESEIETPLLALLGKPEMIVKVTSDILQKTPLSKPRTKLSKLQIENIRKEVLRSLENLPTRLREQQMKHFNSIFSEMKSHR